MASILSRSTGAAAGSEDAIDRPVATIAVAEYEHCLDHSYSLPSAASRGGPRPQAGSTRHKHEEERGRAVKECGLAGLRVHDLRHTAASLAVNSGANPKVAQQMLGHASAAMTLDVYADLFTPDLDDVADRLD